MKIKKILIVGLGSIGKRHLRILKNKYSSVSIIALRRENSNLEDLKFLGLDKSFISISEAIAEKPQAAFITNPSSKHLEIAIKLADAGIHLFIEKPISNSSKGVQNLIDICSKKNIILLTAYNLRFLPSLIKFRDLVNQNKVGKALLVQSEVGQFLPSWRPDNDYKNTVSAKKSLGGGVLLELSHEIDYIDWIFGPIKWVKSHVSRQSSLEIDVEDSATIIMGFDKKNKSGLVSSLSMNFIQHDYSRQCKVIGANGTLLWDGIRNTVKYFPKGGECWELIFSSKLEENFTYIEEIKYFFSLVSTSNLPEINSLNSLSGLRHLITIEAILKSSKKNKIIYL
jgi:predicted dehydrogenase